MKYILGLFLIINTVYGNEFYAKLEPLQTYIIKSSVSGKVIFSNDKIEGLSANNSKIIEIDSVVEKLELNQVNKKIDLISKMIRIENKNYERLKKVRTKSDFDKDVQLLKSLNLESTKADLLIKKVSLTDIIKKKKLIENNRYIYNIKVKKDDYVTAGTILYEAKDLSEGKLEIFVPIKEVDSLKNKTIYLDGKSTDIKIDKIYKVAHSKHISSYKVDIIVPSPKIFSRLIKIEFK